MPDASVSIQQSRATIGIGGADQLSPLVQTATEQADAAKAAVTGALADNGDIGRAVEGCCDVVSDQPSRPLNALNRILSEGASMPISCLAELTGDINRVYPRVNSDDLAFSSGFPINTVTLTLIE